MLQEFHGLLDDYVEREGINRTDAVINTSYGILQMITGARNLRSGRYGRSLMCFLTGALNIYVIHRYRDRISGDDN